MNNERTCNNCIHDHDCYTPSIEIPRNFELRRVSRNGTAWTEEYFRLYVKSVYGQVCNKFESENLKKVTSDNNWDSEENR